MKVYKITTARWAYKLAPRLTSRAQQAYAALNPDEAQSYDAVKAAILRWYNIYEETYRKGFRSLKHKSGQAPTELVTRLMDLAGKWLNNCATADDTVLREHFKAAHPEDIGDWVTKRKPKTPEEAGNLQRITYKQEQLLLLSVNLQVPAQGAQKTDTGQATSLSTMKA